MNRVLSILLAVWLGTLEGRAQETVGAAPVPAAPAPAPVPPAAVTPAEVTRATNAAAASQGSSPSPGPRRSGAKPKVIPPPKPLSLTPRSDRRSDEALQNDREYFKALELAIGRMATNGTPDQTYHQAKALAWLDCARTEYLLGDADGLVEAAVAECTNLIARVSQGVNPPRAPPRLAGAALVRPDLWDLARELQEHPRFELGAASVARLEVQLVWAGHIQSHHGWRRARPGLERAEAIAALARQEILGTAPAMPAPARNPVLAPAADPPRGSTERLLALESRLQAVSNSGLSLRNYGLAKALDWLDLAHDLHHNRDRSGVVAEALTEGERLAALLESGQEAGLKATPSVGRAPRVREDLWAKVDPWREDPRFAEFAAEVARLEVTLVRAAYESRHSSAAQARPHVKDAERLARQVAATLEQPYPTEPPSTSEAPVSVPARP